MSFFEEDKSEEVTKLLSTNIIPRGVNDKKNNKSWLRTIGEFFGLVKRYTADDIDRIKNAGVSIIVSNANIKKAEAEKIMAEAKRVYHQMEIEKEQLEIEKSKLKIDSILAKTEAIERVARAISIIKQNGGEVSFNTDQLKNLLDQSNDDYSDNY